MSKYDIISCVERNRLIETVNKKMAHGWNPVGSPFYSSHAWHQAMVKECGGKSKKEIDLNDDDRK